MSRAISADSAYDREARAKYGDKFVDAYKAAAAEAPPLTDDQVRSLRALFSTSTRQARRSA